MKSQRKDNEWFHSRLYTAMYGHLDDFDFSIIEECDQSKLNEREIYWIDYYKSTEPIYGYNILIGGDVSEHNRILGQNQLNEIANLLATTDLTQTEIANRFGVGQRTVSSVNTGYYNLDKKYIFPIRDKKHVTGKIKERVEQKKARLNERDKSMTGICCDCGGPCSAKAKLCRSCMDKTRISKRPDKDTLLGLTKTMTVSEISREFNVSSTAVKKWCSHYGIIPERKYK